MLVMKKTFCVRSGLFSQSRSQIELTSMVSVAMLETSYSSRQKKVPTTYRLFNVVDKKTEGFKCSFT